MQDGLALVLCQQRHRAVAEGGPSAYYQALLCAAFKLRRFSGSEAPDAQDVGLVLWILGIVAVCGLGVSFILALIYLAVTLFGKAGKHIGCIAIPGGCVARSAHADEWQKILRWVILDTEPERRLCRAMYRAHTTR